MNYGLGLILSFKDNASAPIKNAVGSIAGLTETTEKACASLNSFSDVAVLSSLAMVSSYLGNTFIKMGTSIVGSLAGIVQKVTSTGSTFQSLRITLEALTKDSAKAESSLAKLMDFSATTPFEINDLTGMFTTITANGLDAFKMLEGSTTGIKENLMTAIGDLMAFRPDVPAQRWAVAIRNAFSGEVRSLKNALDINVADKLGRAWGKTAEQVAQDFMDLADALGIAGMMGKNMGTLNQTLSNVSDQVTRIFLAIADTGVFQQLQSSVVELAGALGQIKDQRLDALAKSIGGALSLITKPLQALAKFGAKAITWISTMAETHPKLVKVIFVMTGIIGVTILATGYLLKLVGSFAMLTLVVINFGESTRIMKTLFLSSLAKMKVSLAKMYPLIGAFSLLFFAWKTNFAGFKTATVEFFTKIHAVSKNSLDAISGSLEHLRQRMSYFNGMDNIWGRLAIQLSKVRLLVVALGEAWSDNILSDDTFEKARQLGILPLIETFLDLKYNFENFVAGFKNGWGEISKAVSSAIDGMNTAVEGTALEKVFNAVQRFFENIKTGDSKTWFAIGDAFAKIVLVAVPLITFFNIFGGLIFSVMKLCTVFIKGLLWGLGIVVTTIAGIVGLPAWVVGLIGVAIIALVALLIKYRDKIVSGIKSFGTMIRDFFGGIFGGLSSLIIDKFTAVGEFFVRFKNNVIGLFKNLASKVGEALGGAIKTAVNWVLSSVVNKVNWVIERINGALSLINKIPGVEIGKISKFSVPQFAEGGVVSRPTLSVIGEQGSEAVMPLERNTGWINSLASQIGSKISIQPATPVGNYSATPIKTSGASEIYNNTTNKKSTEQIDNSIQFEANSIVIHVNGNLDNAQIESLTERIIAIIKRKREIRMMMSYQ